MQANNRSFGIQVLVSCFILWAACNSHERPSDKRQAINAEAIAVFQHKLDSISTITYDSTRSTSICALYSSASPEIRDVFLQQVLDKTRLTFFNNVNTDPGLLSFYEKVSQDDSLSPKNRMIMDLHLASYFAHLANDADSAAYYVGRIDQKSGVLADSFAAKWFGVWAQICQLRGQLKVASTDLYKSISFYEKTGDSANVARMNGNLANVYRSMNDFEKSIESRKKALDYFTRVKNDESRAVAIGGLAADFMDIRKVDSARKYFLEGEALFASGVHYPLAEYYLYLSKAGMYVTLRQYDSSIRYFDKAKKILALFNDQSQEMVFTIASTIAYSHERNVAKEAALIESYIPKLLAEEDLQRARDVYFSLYNISLKQKLKRDPVDYYQQFDSLKNVLADKENREFVAEMESKYESQKKTITIQAQEKEIQRRKAMNLILILSTVMVALTAGFIIVRLQLLRTRKEARLQQQFTLHLLNNTEDERKRIAAELHDGIGHELLSLKNNLKLGIDSSETKINSIINDLRMISRNLHPVVLDQIGLEHSIRYLCEQLMGAGQIFVSTEIEYNNQLARKDELQLYRIIQESLNNVVKYAGAVAAKISILSAHDKLIVTVMDNGRGFDVEEKMRTEQAFGLNSMIQRAKAMGGKISINSTPEGTIIHLEIPINHAFDHNS